MKVYKIIIIVFLVLISLGTIWLFMEKKEEVSQAFLEEECPVEKREHTIHGNSLSPLIEDNSQVEFLWSYYDCNEVKRGDIILYNYTGSEDPLIKIIKGLPGDTFSLQEEEERWNILVNEKILKNSAGKPYIISERKHNMLSLYTESYDNEIPEEAYLILSDNPAGGLDSTHFGLIDMGDILGKINLK